MKTLVTLALFISTNAFATHAYRTEHCKSATHNLDYRGNYPYGGMYGISLPGQEDTTALPSEEGETPTRPDEAEVLFTEVSSKILEDSGEMSQCYFDHREWTSKKVIRVDTISIEAAIILGLQAGDKITFICEETSDFPNGNNCED